MNSELSKTISKVLETQFHFKADIALNEFEMSITSDKVKLAGEICAKVDDKEITKLVKRKTGRVFILSSSDIKIRIDKGCLFSDIINLKCSIGKEILDGIPCECCVKNISINNSPGFLKSCASGKLADIMNNITGSKPQIKIDDLGIIQKALVDIRTSATIAVDETEYVKLISYVEGIIKQRIKCEVKILIASLLLNISTHGDDCSLSAKLDCSINLLNT